LRAPIEQVEEFLEELAAQSIVQRVENQENEWIRVVPISCKLFLLLIYYKNLKFLSLPNPEFNNLFFIKNCAYKFGAIQIWGPQ
jgi:hypothetical protein